MKILLWTICLFIFRSSAQDLDTNNKCSYALSKSVFDCSGLEDVTKNVKNFLTPQTRMLVIRNSKKASFSAYSHNVTNYQHIISYNILDNDQLDIDGFAFHGMTSLRFLRIAGNFLFRVKNNSFKGLDSLEILTLSENNITTLEGKSFSGLKRLITLDLAKNNIEIIRSRSFVDLSRLQILSIERNSIKMIENDAFVGLSKLELLDLRFNNIKILNAKDFNILTNLETLYLNFNKIENIYGYLNSSKLMFLQLDNNQLKEIGDNTFKNLLQTVSIDLSNNNLGNLTEKPFLQLPSLQHLNLKNNNVNLTGFNNLKDISVVV
jgi:Leucine-rich repeat (LRR) protein